MSNTAKVRAIKIRKARALHVKRKRKARKSMLFFTDYSKDEYQAMWFNKMVCKYLDKLLKGDIKKLMIFMPPQHGKSELSSRRFPAYLLGRNPDLKLALCSYSSSLASGFNRAVQMIMDDPKYIELFPNTRLNSKRVATDTGAGVLRNSEMFEVVGHKGYLKTVGVGGSLTGFTVDIGIIDDPFKDRAEANSLTYRNTKWAWYQDVFCTRQQNSSKQLMLFTRWHNDDLAGRILDPSNEHYDAEEASEWTVIALPALKEKTKPIPQAIDVNDPRLLDEALWESRHSAAKYIKRRRINPTGFQSLDQQRPTAEGGNKIQKEWLQIIKKSKLPFDPDRISADFFIDGAYTEKVQNDPTATLACYHHKKTGNLYLFNCTAVRKELHAYLPYFKDFAQHNYRGNKSRVYIELKATGHDAKGFLRKPEYGGFHAIGINDKVVRKGKFNRVENAEPILASMKVFLVQGGWNAEFINECLAFPNGRHDDMVDDLTYAISKYYLEGKGGGVSYE